MQFSEWLKLQESGGIVWLPNEGGFAKLPASWIRFGLPPQEAGRPVASTNWADKRKEKGLSVYAAWHDPKTNKYVLQGGDEQLLHTQASFSDGSLKA